MCIRDSLTMAPYTNMPDDVKKLAEEAEAKIRSGELHPFTCLLYTSDAADERSSVDLGGRRILKKKTYVASPYRVTHTSSTDKHTSSATTGTSTRTQNRQ